MDRRARLVMLWLEEEGARRRRKAPPRPEVGYAAWHGWAKVGAYVLCGALASGLFVCWRAEAWDRAYRVGIMERFRVPAGMTLADARVVAVARAAEPSRGAPALTLTVRHGGLLVPCEFRAESAPRNVRVGDIVSVWGRKGRVEEGTAPVLLKDCELALWPRRPWE